MLLKKPITKTNGSVSTHWRVVEYNHNLIDEDIKLVLWGYTSEEIARDNPRNVNDVKVYTLSTKKIFTPQEVMETIQHPAIEAVEEVVDEEGNVVTPAIEAAPAWEETRGTGEFIDVWVNQNTYIDVEPLVSQIMPFIHSNLIAGGDFINAELV